MSGVLWYELMLCSWWARMESDSLVSVVVMALMMSSDHPAPVRTLLEAFVISRSSAIAASVLSMRRNNMEKFPMIWSYCATVIIVFAEVW